MIDTTNQAAIQKITLKDLVDDAVERNDKPALRWLEDESDKQIERKKSDGTINMVDKTIVAIRAEYLRKYLEYVLFTNYCATAKAKAKKVKSAMFAYFFLKVRQRLCALRC